MRRMELEVIIERKIFALGCLDLWMDSSWKNTSSGARDVEIRNGNEQMKKLKASYDVTTPQELYRNHIKEEGSQHHWLRRNHFITLTPLYSGCPHPHGYAVTRINSYGITNSKSINRALIFAFKISIPSVVSRQEEGGKVINSPGVKPSTSASGSQPSGNTKKDKIQQTLSSTPKNKVEAHYRTVKSSLKNKNYVVEPNETANVQHSKLNANSKLLCVKCNGCMLSDNHDLCVLNFINDVNARVKSKSVKKSSKRKVWKPTGKVFTNIGYTWRPTGQTFTIV
ncbi:hypothetical protein Tco_0745912 [Tanacetum coccineum]